MKLHSTGSILATGMILAITFTSSAEAQPASKLDGTYTGQSSYVSGGFGCGGGTPHQMTIQAGKASDSYIRPPDPQISLSGTATGDGAVVLSGAYPDGRPVHVEGKLKDGVFMGGGTVRRKDAGECAFTLALKTSAASWPNGEPTIVTAPSADGGYSRDTRTQRCGGRC